MLLALVLSSILPRWNRIIGAPGNIALRTAGVALVIVALMFQRASRQK
jgi:hypothetical protein